MNIIFQDIDGPLIPYRMYFGGDRPYNQDGGHLIYDPVAVAMINQLCQKCNAQVVYNSAHNNGSLEELAYKSRMNNIMFMHPTIKTNFNCGVYTYNRREAIEAWLKEHPEDGHHWIVIDDMPVYKPRQIEVDYNVGMTLENYQRAYWLLSGKTDDVSKYVSYR